MHIPQTEVILRHEGAELARVTLPPGDYVIGRNADVEIFADTPLISRRHAQLTINYDHLLIEDLGSSNGTFVNEQRIAEATRLYPNQAVRLGDITVELHRERAPSEPGVSLMPSQAAIRRFLPDELLAERRYAIGSQIARGGMGAILDARQTTIDRTVAMKVMLGSGDEGDVLRFIDEAKITGQLDHPNIVPIYELGVDEQDQLFYTMKLVRGITLKKVLELMARGVEATVKKYPLPALLTIFQKVCDALAFAHSRGVIHRDLKPENLMLGDFGSVLVMDWGLAKVLAQNEARPAGMRGGSVMSLRTSAPELGSTMTGDIMGTPQYMAPEQARGEVELLDARSDIYALGAILFEILHLRPTVTGDDAMQIVEKVARGEIAWPTAKELRAVPASLSAICRKALALDPAARYRSVEDLQADVLAYQNGFATSAEHASFGKQLLLAVRRNKAASLGVAAVLLVGSVLGTKAILEGRRAEREAAAAKATLADLRRTAPVFAEQARVVFDEGNLADALEKIGYAIQLDPAQPDYHLFRAHLLQSSQNLADAAEGYRRVLALRPADAAAQTNLALCEKLRQESGGAPLSRPQQLQLLAALRTQKRLVEAAPLAALVNPDIALARAALLARLRDARKQAGWKDSNVTALPDGTFRVSLSQLALIDLSVLRGQPVTALDLTATSLADLSNLAGLPLKELSLRATKVTDLSPLEGMPLENLSIQSTPVTDLSPLRGMKLQKLDMSDTKVANLRLLTGMPLTWFSCANCRQISDLSPLRGAPLKAVCVRYSGVADLTPLRGCPLLEDLDITMTGVADLSPLAGMHLARVLCGAGPRITSIAPLRGMPLRILDLFKTNVTDLSPLAGSTTLEEIRLPLQPGDLSMLRELPRLKLIAARQGTTENYPYQSTADFWAAYEAPPAAGSLRHPGEPPAPLPPSSAGKK